MFSTSKTYKLSFWLKYREQTINFIVWFKLSSCQNWEIISNRNILVLQYVVLASSLFLRLIHNHIYNIQDKCKNELSLYLKAKKTYMANSHCRRVKELNDHFFLFFSVLALVLPSFWIWLKQKDYLAWLTTTMKYFATVLSMFLFDIVSWLLQDNVCKLWCWWRK